MPISAAAFTSTEASTSTPTATSWATAAAVFTAITRTEYIESLHLDYVLGAYDNGELIGVAVIVDNRKSERNLASKFHLNCAETYTFDIVFVKEEYRGLGLQKAFIDIAKAQAKIDGLVFCSETRLGQ